MLCRICKKNKSNLDFYTSQKDQFCKECRRLIQANYRKTHPYTKEQTRKWSKKYTQSKKGKLAIIRASNIAREKHKHKWTARAKLRYAVKLGIVKKPNHCEKCLVTKIQAHHHKGYDKEYELDVQWLCSKHHAEIHNINL